MGYKFIEQLEQKIVEFAELHSPTLAGIMEKFEKGSSFEEVMRFYATKQDFSEEIKRYPELEEEFSDQKVNPPGEVLYRYFDRLKHLPWYVVAAAEAIAIADHAGFMFRFFFSEEEGRKAQLEVQGYESFKDLIRFWQEKQREGEFLQWVGPLSYSESFKKSLKSVAIAQIPIGVFEKAVIPRTPLDEGEEPSKRYLSIVRKGTNSPFFSLFAPHDRAGIGEDTYYNPNFEELGWQNVAFFFSG
jgi:hypothetical protein